MGEELRALVEAATPGPWRYIGTGSEGGSIVWTGRGRVARLDSLALPQINADAAFIAAARTEVPRLLDRVTALEKAVQLAIDVDHLRLTDLDAKYPELVVGDPAGNHWSERYIATLRAALSQEATQEEGTDGRG